MKNNLILRTEVIWKPEPDPDIDCDVEDSCPISFDFFFFHFVQKKKKRLALISAAAFLFFIGTLSISCCASNLNVLEYESDEKVSTWSDSLEKDYSPAMQARNSDGTNAQNTSKQIILPKTFDDNIADVDEPLRSGDTPFYFHIPRSAGATLKDILGSCASLTTASDVGARHGHSHDTNLTIVCDELGSKYVNVDTSTLPGIIHAKELGLIESGLANVVISQYIHDGATLFNPTQRGRMFTMIRHPIERAVSLFHYLPIAHWEPTYDPDLQYISIEMYARSLRIEHNWMVRFLSNELEQDLTHHHLDIAKEVLRKKCIIGLLEEKEESWDRFQRFFRWKFPTQRSRECQDRLLHWGWSNKYSHPTVVEGSHAWNLLFQRNELDMALYYFAKKLFEEQDSLFGLRGSLVT